MDFKLKLMENFTCILQEHLGLAVFLTLSLDFALRHLKISAFKIRVISETFIAGILNGQLNIVIPPIIKTTFFSFAIGYELRQQFFQGLKVNTCPQLTLTTVFVSLVF